MGIKVFKLDQMEDLIQSMNRTPVADSRFVLLLDRALNDHQAKLVKEIEGLVCFALEGCPGFGEALPAYIHGVVGNPEDPLEMRAAIQTATRHLELQQENQLLRLKMYAQKNRLEVVLRTALEISEEKDAEQLYVKILSSMRKLAHCEGASLYLVESGDKTQLRFKSVQNEFIDWEWTEFLLPIDEHSMAGACALKREVILVGDVNQIPEGHRFKFNRDFDKKTGYQTRSALCVPLQKTTGELVGLIQLINSKRENSFANEDIEVVKAISAHVASSLEAVVLYKEIENLFEGIIKASVTAIESRDPNTSGHSERVGKMAVAFATALHETEDGDFKDIQYTSDQLRMIRYAATLHDFGKIGVSEGVLLKAKKLYPEQAQILQMRLEVLCLAHPIRKEEFSRLWESVQRMNEPSVNVEDLAEDLSHYVGEVLPVGDRELPILTPEEWEALSVRKGTLTKRDRAAVESHVHHSVNFLQQIPWPEDLGQIPEIVLRHHETLDGTGYPHQVRADQIPFETQMISIVDIFDALTAKDRSYKKSQSVEKTIEILESMAQQGKLNAQLVQFFKENQIYQLS